MALEWNTILMMITVPKCNFFFFWYQIIQLKTVTGKVTVKDTLDMFLHVSLLDKIHLSVRRLLPYSRNVILRFNINWQAKCHEENTGPAIQQKPWEMHVLVCALWDLMCDIHVHTLWMACQSIAGLERGVKTGLRELMFGHGALVI